MGGTNIKSLKFFFYCTFLTIWSPCQQEQLKIQQEQIQQQQNVINQVGGQPAIVLTTNNRGQKTTTAAGAEVACVNVETSAARAEVACMNAEASAATDTQSVIESIAGDTAVAVLTVDHFEVSVEAESPDHQGYIIPEPETASPSPPSPC